MPRKKLEKIADMTFSFRLSKIEKERLEKRIETIRNQMNKDSPKDEYKITKNDVILSSLKKGLLNLSFDDLPKRNKREDTY